MTSGQDTVDGATRGPRVLVCGECVVDLVSAGGRSWTAHPGGSPANVAVTLARLEVPVALLARLSTDAFGGMLREHLSGSGVDLSPAVSVAEPSTLAVASLDAAGVATYDFWVQGTADAGWTDGELPQALPEGVQAFHTGSMALELAPGGAVLRALVRRLSGTVLLSYDPNVRLARRGDRATALAEVEELVGYCDVVKASSEDVDWLLPGLSAEQVLQRWSVLGPALTVVTDGPHGALSRTSDGTVRRTPSPSVVVVDTVGAGDAFSAGLLAGLDDQGLLTRDALRTAAAGGAGSAGLDRALRLAAAVAATTCTRPGADPPRRAEIG